MNVIHVALQDAVVSILARTFPEADEKCMSINPRYQFIINRVVASWNQSSPSVVVASTVSQFRKRLDRLLDPARR